MLPYVYHKYYAEIVMSTAIYSSTFVNRCVVGAQSAKSTNNGKDVILHISGRHTHILQAGEIPTHFLSQVTLRQRKKNCIIYSQWRMQLECQF